LHPVPLEEISRRISRLQGYLKDRDIDAALIIHRPNLYYFSGTAQNAVLYIPRSSEPLLMVKKYYPRARKESPLRKVTGMKGLREIREKIDALSKGNPGRLGLELDTIPVREASFYSAMFAASEILDVSPFIMRTRSIKSGWEISKLRETAKRSALSFGHAKALFSQGIEGPSLSARLELFMRRHRHQAMIRIRGFRKRMRPVSISPVPSLGSGAILLQLTWAYLGYHHLEGRVLFGYDARGHSPKRLEALSQTLLEIKSLVKPGATWGDISSWLERQGEGYRLFGCGVGLEVMEVPVAGEDQELPFDDGMVLAIGIRPNSPGGGACLMETGLITKDGFSLLRT